MRKTKTVDELHKIPAPKLTEKDYSFFSTLADAVSVFKSHDLPRANCKGCIVSPRKGKDGKRIIKFIFAIAYGRTMDAEIDIDSLEKNPKEYVDALLEGMNEAYKIAHSEFDTPIISLGGNKLLSAVQAVNATRH